MLCSPTYAQHDSQENDKEVVIYHGIRGQHLNSSAVFLLKIIADSQQTSLL